MSRYVIDASAGLYLLSRREPVGHRFDAPTLFVSEATSVLHETVWRGELSRAVATAHVERLSTLDLTLHDSATLVDAAWALADRLGWAKTYDAEYIALAEQLGLPLLTADRRLARGLRGLVAVADPGDIG